MNVIMMKLDDMLFFTSDYQIEQNDYIACYFSYSIGTMYAVKKNSVYGENLLKMYKNGDYTILNKEHNITKVEIGQVWKIKEDAKRHWFEDKITINFIGQDYFTYKEDPSLRSWEFSLLLDNYNLITE